MGDSFGHYMANETARVMAQLNASAARAYSSGMSPIESYLKDSDPLYKPAKTGVTTTPLFGYGASTRTGSARFEGSTSTLAFEDATVMGERAMRAGIRPQRREYGCNGKYC